MRRGDEHIITITDHGWTCTCGDGEAAGLTAYEAKVEADNHADYFGGIHWGAPE